MGEEGLFPQANSTVDEVLIGDGRSLMRRSPPDGLQKSLNVGKM